MTRTVAHLPPSPVEPLRPGTACRGTAALLGDPAFLLDGEHRLHLGDSDRAGELKTLLTHAIVRRPGDLRLHVQRILLCADTRDPAILGALCDLFLVLGRRGSSLRRRLLALARPLLSGFDHHKLRRQLDGEPGPDDGPLDALCAGAALSHGITGTTQLISRQPARAPQQDDPLVSANRLIGDGRTAQAQETLERALRVNPARLALHLALLEIHRHSRDRRRAAASWESLQGLENPAATEWRRLLRQLEEES